MLSQAKNPGDHKIMVYGQIWCFSARALEALATIGPITDATLGFCAKNLHQQVEDLNLYFEVDYFDIGLCGRFFDGEITTDILPSSSS